MTHLFALRDKIADMLGGHFNDLGRFDERPAVTVFMPENPVGIVVGEMPDGTVIITIEAPLLFDVPEPRPAVLRRLLNRGQQFEAVRRGPVFGRLVALFRTENFLDEPGGAADIYLEAQILPDGLTPELLVKSVRLLHARALIEIDYLRQIEPSIGGSTVAEG